MPDGKYVMVPDEATVKYTPGEMQVMLHLIAKHSPDEMRALVKRVTGELAPDGPKVILLDRREAIVLSGLAGLGLSSVGQFVQGSLEEMEKGEDEKDD